MTTPHPFAVYIHWPFCAQKCPYCDFNSHVRHDGWDEAAYLGAYLTELRETRRLTGPQRVHSIFFGGGTPSLMQPQTVAGLIDEVARLWTMEPDAEITLEANPGSVEADRFKGYRAAGVNRVSVGVQSLIDADLKALGRIHSVAEARRAVGIAQATFERTSFDLIYARQHQTLQSWEAELRDALSFQAGHLSLYQLTIEPQTTFERLYAAGKLTLPDGDLSHDLYAMTQAMTEAAGIPAYEISNHARRGQESRHNLVYWRYGTYVGVGPGAHGRLLIDGVRHGTVAEKIPEAWMKRVLDKGHGRVEDDVIGPREGADEALLMGLRLVEGFDLAHCAKIGGVRPTREAIDELVGHGMIERLGGTRIRATAQGRLVLNRVVLELSKAFEVM
ncbi:MAG: coproporphyrinogen III oxidase [Hyphomicrobiaceae bacterium]|nr:coproporphyrinogen III oxidase [Hyphomicrobiaceae bacterium]